MRGLETVKPLDHWKRFLLPALVLALAFSLFLGVRPASADTSSDLKTALSQNGWYISTAAKAKLGDINQAQKNIEDAVKKLKDRKHPAVIALVDQSVLPQECSAAGVAGCADYFTDVYFKNPALDIAIVVDVPNKKIGLRVKNVNATEQDVLVKSVSDVFSRSISEGAAFLGTKSADKIDADVKSAADTATQAIDTQKKQDQNSFVTTLIVLGVAVLAIAGAFAFLIITSKSIWRKKVEELQKSANQVSDMVYDLSTEVEYLPDGEKQRAQDTFNQGAMQVTSANDAAAQIKAASTISLVFKWGQYNNQYKDALKKMESIRETLQSVKTTVNRDINRA